MINSMYPFWSFVFSVVLAQLAKPFFAYFKTHKFDIRLVHASGGMPSSHTAGVFGLCLSVGLRDQFSSSLFAICLAFGLIVAYDAANVRYYAGKNIQLTKQIIQELKEKNDFDLDEPIYEEPIKEILGHKWSEVVGGAAFGVIVSLVLYLLFVI